MKKSDVKRNRTSRFEEGAATLIVAVMLLIGVTLVGLFAARIGVLDQRISGNEYRHKEAFANAEAALEQAASYLRANPVLHEGNTADGWNSCAGNETIFPCDVSGAEMLFGDIVSGAAVSAVDQITAQTNSESHLVKTASGIVALGVGATEDQTGAAMAQVEYAKASLLQPGELPPLMMPSGDLSGNFNIVPNPNGGGPGVPISIWASTDTDTSGSNWKTCHHDQFRDGGVCMDIKGDGVTGDDWQNCKCGDEISNSTDVNSDIVFYPPDKFPDSPFVYVFGEPGVDDPATLQAEVKARAQSTGLVLPNCDTIDSDFADLTGSALVWVEGDCKIGSNIVVGNRDKPIILVVEGDIHVNAGMELWGIFLGLANFTLNGGPVIHGSAISEIESDLTNGTYSQVYDESVFSNLTDDTINIDIAKVSYSWRDFTP